MNQNDRQIVEALQKEYAEVSKHFGTLTEIRFKLLAFLPIAGALAVIFAKDAKLSTVGLVSLFGLVVTIGVLIYNTRNDQLYDALIGRAAEIERLCGLPGGAFANRSGSWLTIKLFGVKCNIDHRTGVSIIYAATIALWIFGVYAVGINAGWRIFNNYNCKFDWWCLVANTGNLLKPVDNQSEVSRLIWILALMLAVLSSCLAAKLIANQKRSRERQMRKLAKEAVDQLLSLNLAGACEDSRFIARCAKLGGIDPQRVHARASFYLSLDKDQLRHYMPLAPELVAMSQFLSLLTDLPPLWIYDCATNRRGRLE